MAGNFFSGSPYWRADPDTGQPMDRQETVNLAINLPLAAGEATTPMTLTRSRVYGIDVQFAGTSPSLTVEKLAADGTTWTPVVAAYTTSPNGGPVNVFAGAGGAQVRLKNTGANPLTGVYGRMTS